MKENPEIILDKCREIIKKFLSEKTKYTNGYATNIDGVVELRTHGCMHIYYPEAGDKTHKQMRLEGFALYEDLYKAVEQYLETYKIKVSSEHIEDGCNRIKISIIYESSI